MFQFGNSIKYYIGAAVVVIAAVFLSQQGYFDGIGKSASAAISGYWAKGSNWVTSQAYPTLSEEMQKRGEVISNEIKEEKENISENVLQKVGDYFSGIADSIVNPEKTSCETTQPSQ